MKTFKNKMDAIEKQFILQALMRCQGNQSKAAVDLGLNRTALIAKIKKHGLSTKKILLPAGIQDVALPQTQM